MFCCLIPKKIVKEIVWQSLSNRAYGRKYWKLFTNSHVSLVTHLHTGGSDFFKISSQNYCDSQFLCKKKILRTITFMTLFEWRSSLLANWHCCDFTIHKQNASNDYGDSSFLCKTQLSEQTFFMTVFDWRSSSLANRHCKFFPLYTLFLKSVILQ